MPVATKVQLIGGAFQDSEGNLLANGFLKMTLNQDESITGVGQICSGIEIRINLNSSGGVSVSPVQSVWGNDQMLPVNSYYRVSGYNSSGQLAWGPNNQQVNGSGGTFDVGTWVPNVVLSWFPPLQATELQTNGVDNGDQTLLNLKNGTNVTITDDGSGGVTINSTGSGSVSSVALTAPVEFSVAGSPVTTSGTLAISKATQAKNTVWAGPVSGANAQPTFRNLMAADIQFALVNNNFRYWKAGVNTASLAGVAIAGTTIGTSAVAPGVVGPTATAPGFVSFATSATNPSQQTVTFTGMNGFGVTPNLGQIWTTQTLVLAKWKGGLDSISSVRLWVGLGDMYNANFTNWRANNPSGQNLIAFRYSSGTDTNFQAVCQNAGTQTVVDTGIPADTVAHDFRIDVDSASSITFYIDNVLVATIATNIPTNTTRFGDFISIDNNGGSSARTFSLSYWYSLEL
jgi:hypothetical protein